MYGRRFAPLFVAVLLTSLAGSTVNAQGPYDPQVAARFLGTWKWLANLHPNQGAMPSYPYLVIEDRSTHALVKWWALDTQGIRLEAHEGVAFTQDEKLLLYVGGKVTEEYIILENGHLLTTSTDFYQWPNPRPTPPHQLIFEYVRVSGPFPVSTPAPASPVAPVVPVQPVMPGVGQTGFPKCSELGYTPGLIPQILAAETLQCTKHVYKLSETSWLRECWKDAYPNAKDWDEKARSQQSRDCGITVTDKNDIRVGDVVVWEANCGGTSPGKCEAPDWKGCGHVAVVTSVDRNKGTIRVNEANWEARPSPDIPILTCMSFIHKPGNTRTPPPQPSWWDKFLQLLRSCFGFCR